MYVTPVDNGLQNSAFGHSAGLPCHEQLLLLAPDLLEQLKASQMGGSSKLTPPKLLRGRPGVLAGTTFTARRFWQPQAKLVTVSYQNNRPAVAPAPATA